MPRRKGADGSLFGYTACWHLMVALSDANGGMSMALTAVTGDKEDAGTCMPQSIETGPFITLLFLVGADPAKSRPPSL